jgi:hypothetical protein
MSSVVMLRVAPTTDLPDPCRFIRALATAPTSKARRNVLRQAMDTLGGRVEAKELESTVPGIPVVVQCLVRASRQALWMEVEGLCLFLWLILRCAAPQVGPVLESVLAALLSVLLQCLNKVGIAASVADYSEVSPALVGALYQLLEEISSFRISLCRMKDAPLLLQLLQRVIRNDGMRYLESVQVEAVRLLSGIASHTENARPLLLSYPALVRTLTTARLPTGSELYTASFLRHLAWDPVNRNEMIGMRPLVFALLSLSTHKQARTLDEVLRAFSLLSTSARARWVLVQQRRFLKLLIVALKQPELRSVALSTLLNLTGPQTAKRIVDCSGLLEAIVGVCANEDVTPAVAQTIKKLATHMGACERRHPFLIAAMVKLSVVPDPQVRLWVSKAFLEQSKIASSSFFVVRTPKVLEIVLKLCRDEHPPVQTAATEAVMHFASTKANHQQLVAHPSVLRTMVENALLSNSDCEWTKQTCHLAVRTIICLLSCGEKSRVASELDVLVCLAHFAVSRSHESELKSEALKVLINLAAFL